MKYARYTLAIAALAALGFSAPAPAQAAYDGAFIGEEKVYIAGAEDTLTHIARRFDLGFVELRAANPSMDPWIPGKGAEVFLPGRHLLPDAPRSGLVINLPEMRLYAFVNGNEAPLSFPLGIGREGLETPIGTTSVESKKVGPVWRPTPRMLREDPTLKPVVQPGPDNPLGTHAMYLGWPQYRIHGTNKPYGIGRRSSSGCLRLYPEDIISLYKVVPVGMKVTVVNQPIKLAWIDGVLYMEAHPDMDQALQMEETGEVYSAKMTTQDMAFIISAAGEFENKLDWATIRNAVRDRTGTPIIIARKPGAVVDDSRPEVIRANEVDLNDFSENNQKREELKKAEVEIVPEKTEPQAGEEKPEVPVKAAAAEKAEKADEPKIIEASAETAETAADQESGAEDTPAKSSSVVNP